MAENEYGGAHETDPIMCGKDCALMKEIISLLLVIHQNAPVQTNDDYSEECKVNINWYST